MCIPTWSPPDCYRATDGPQKGLESTYGADQIAVYIPLHMVRCTGTQVQIVPVIPCVRDCACGSDPEGARLKAQLSVVNS